MAVYCISEWLGCLVWWSVNGDQCRSILSRQMTWLGDSSQATLVDRLLVVLQSLVIAGSRGIIDISLMDSTFSMIGLRHWLWLLMIGLIIIDYFKTPQFNHWNQFSIDCRGFCSLWPPRILAMIHNYQPFWTISKQYVRVGDKPSNNCWVMITSATAVRCLAMWGQTASAKNRTWNWDAPCDFDACKRAPWPNCKEQHAIANIMVMLLMVVIDG